MNKTNQRKYRKQNNSVVLKTGIKKIDDIYEIKCPSFTLIKGEAGSGKTLLMENIAKNMSNGNKVVYINTSGNYHMEKFYNCHVFSFPMASSIKSIMKCLDALTFKDAIIIIDGIDLIDDGNHETLMDHHMSVIRQFVTYCCKKDIALIIAIQTGITEINTEKVIATHNMECSADSVWLLDLVSKTNLEITFAKIRTSANGQKINLKIDAKKREISD
jgi:predicted ATP-dependent serine protease